MKLISTNPSRNYEVVGEVEASTTQDIVEAVAKARTAQVEWAALPLAKRCSYLAAFADVSQKRSEEIAQAIATETGRRIQEARKNVTLGLDYLTSYLETAEKHLAPQVTVETDTEIHRVYREPWGVVAAICPWNYPFANVVWQCGQALIAGNAIVYKNSEENPLFATLVADLFDEAGLPNGVFNVVYGAGEVGDMLAHADIDMISFTGSAQVGHALANVAAQKFIPIVTELGGSSPCIVFEDIEITDEFAENLFTKRFVNAGQICSSVKRLIVHESKFDETVEKLRQATAVKKVGDARDEDTDVGPLVAQRQLERIEEQVQDAVGKGAKVETGGKRPDGLAGAYFLPTILTNVTPGMRVWHEETFGPVLPVVSFESEAEAVKLANDTEYGLGAHVYTHDKERFERVARQIQSGMVAQNDVNYFHPHNPFGGYKRSGMGRIHGEFGFHEMTQVKLVSEEK